MIKLTFEGASLPDLNTAILEYLKASGGEVSAPASTTSGATDAAADKPKRTRAAKADDAPADKKPADDGPTVTIEDLRAKASELPEEYDEDAMKEINRLGAEKMSGLLKVSNAACLEFIAWVDSKIAAKSKKRSLDD